MATFTDLQYKEKSVHKNKTGVSYQTTIAVRSCTQIAALMLRETPEESKRFGEWDGEAEVNAILETARQLSLQNIFLSMKFVSLSTIHQSCEDLFHVQL